MSMSHDRVEFTIDVSKMNTIYRRVFYRAFGTRLGGPYKMKNAGLHWPGSPPAPVKVVCRPSQFARFLIYRNEAGISNSVKELEPRLFIPSEKVVLDVSAERHDPTRNDPRASLVGDECED